MSTKHTPGPWHWDSDPIDGDPLGRVRFQVVALGRTITKTYYSSGDATAEADTRLIAAAPDLLLALHNMLEDGDKTDRQQAIAAIAKATGIRP